MHWIVERAPRDEDKDPMLSLVTKRFAGNDDIGRLISVLVEKQIPHDVVRKPPMADYLVSMTGDDPIHLQPDGPVFAYGSTTLQNVAENSGWNPGYFDAPEMLEAIDHWGEHMLNYEAKVEEIGKMSIPSGTFFIRPNDDGKAFAGTIMTHEEFDAWRDRILDIDGWTTVPADTKVLYAPVRQIHAEWRLAIVNGTVAASSMYRKNGKLKLEEGCPHEVQEYALARISEWEPRAGFIMDVCATEEGLRIVETNSLSSSGLYLMNMNTYVDAIEKIHI
jgi:hypothetical protein